MEIGCGKPFGMVKPSKSMSDVAFLKEPKMGGHNRMVSRATCQILGTIAWRPAGARAEAIIPRRQLWESPCFSMMEFFPINSTEEVGHELMTNLNSFDMKNLFAVAPFTTTMGDPISLCHRFISPTNQIGQRCAFMSPCQSFNQVLPISTPGN
ncbi:hypothetical protein Ccrd_002078 [Cynara cardunculus var. scolymus]|uniref:Uncharacterized protein n=1 Tax=Cynara cardunculus var. scolymus TaxID=59895 RepID=A0A103XS32_CYNCS|nr:hypothetical protein Ccrd_002078 [Cynara cardunculus var. scolymus]